MFRYLLTTLIKIILSVANSEGKYVKLTFESVNNIE